MHLSTTPRAAEISHDESDADSDREVWGPEPDPLMDRVRERAQTLRAAEKLALTAQAERSRADLLETLNANQQRRVEDLERAFLAERERTADRDNRLDELEAGLARDQRNRSIARSSVGSPLPRPIRKTLRWLTRRVGAPFKAVRRLSRR